MIAKDAMTFNEAHHQIKRGNVIGLKRALDAGLDPNLVHKFGATLLMLAACTGNTSIGKLLLERGADPDARDSHRGTALSDAIMAGHANFVRLLLEHGASLDCHPHGNSLDIFLEWCAEYTRATPEQVKKIKTLIDAERSRREQSNGTT